MKTASRPHWAKAHHHRSGKFSRFIDSIMGNDGSCRAFQALVGWQKFTAGLEKSHVKTPKTVAATSATCEEAQTQTRSGTRCLGGSVGGFVFESECELNFRGRRLIGSFPPG